MFPRRRKRSKRHSDEDDEDDNTDSPVSSNANTHTDTDHANQCDETESVNISTRGNQENSVENIPSEVTTEETYAAPVIKMTGGCFLRSTDLHVVENPTKEDYMISPCGEDDGVQVKITDDIEVLYTGVPFIVKASDETSQSDFSNPPKVGPTEHLPQPVMYTTLRYGEDDFTDRRPMVILPVDTPISIDEDFNQTGLRPRLQNNQEFEVMPGSELTIPAGAKMYIKTDKNKKIVKLEEPVTVTLHPGLPEITVAQTTTASTHVSVSTSSPSSPSGGAKSSNAPAKPPKSGFTNSNHKNKRVGKPATRTSPKSRQSWKPNSVVTITPNDSRQSDSGDNSVSISTNHE